jgi:hypothetical protein
MLLLARAALIVRPKRRFVDWVNAIDHGGPKYSIEEARTNPTVYLVYFGPGDQERPFSEFVDEVAEEVFEAQLSQWSEDEAAWPANRSPHGFRQFFDVEFADTVCDVDEDDPISVDEDVERDLDEGYDEDLYDEDEDSEDEEAQDLDEDELQSLHELAVIVSRCAWCERDLPEDGPRIAVAFARIHPPESDEDPDSSVVAFPLRHIGRTLIGVRPPPGEDPIPGADLVITVCSEACRAALIVAVEKEKELR